MHNTQNIQDVDSNIYIIDQPLSYDSNYAKTYWDEYIKSRVDQLQDSDFPYSEEGFVLRPNLCIISGTEKDNKTVPDQYELIQKIWRLGRPPIKCTDMKPFVTARQLEIVRKHTKTRKTISKSCPPRNVEKPMYSQVCNFIEMMKTKDRIQDR